MTKQLLEDVNSGKVNFAGVLVFIDDRYAHTPTAFKNGNQLNAASENQGSARVLYFAKLNQLNKEETLQLFAEHYQAVLDHPGADNHQNIRQFMQHGWEAVEFDGIVLSPR